MVIWDLLTKFYAKLRLGFYQQDRVLLSKVIFFLLMMRKQLKCRGNYKPCFESPSEVSLEINPIKGL